jgi:lysophospholipase L1-like esterase
LYKNPLASVHNQPSTAGQPVAKQLSRPPDLTLKDADGKQLAINPQTMAFSEDGSWMVVETLSGSFVRINLASLDMMAFAPAFGTQGSPGLLKSQVTVSSDGHYVAISNKEAGSLKVYDLTNCGLKTAGLLPQDCAAYDYQPFITRKVAGFQDMKHLRFVNDGLLSFEVQASDPASSGVYELAPTGSITSLIDYLALGDSYTSGEGAFDYLAGTDTSDDRCHLSVHAYPLLLTQDIFSGAGSHSVACSGAKINDVGSTNPSYRGQVRGVGSLQQLQQSQAALLGSIMSDYSPGYVAQQRFLQQYQPAITTVSIGGNDIGFGDILQHCVAPHISAHHSANTCFSTYEERLEVTNLIGRTVPRWIALYKQLLHEAPGTTLYVIGYPQIVYDQGNCALNVHLDAAELEFSEELIDYLNGAIKQATDAAGVHYIDISQALVGHRLCEAASYDVAVNGLTAGTDSGPLGLRIFGQESYHPNALGHALIEQAILKQTNNFRSFTITAAGSETQSLLNAPKTGRSINTLVPDDNLTAGVVQIDRNVSAVANGSRDGLVPNSVYSIRLDGASGPIVSSVTSNEYGDISANLSLPSDTVPGEHTIDITGSNQAGEAVDVTQPIYVPASDSDADGDSIPDTLVLVRVLSIAGRIVIRMAPMTPVMALSVLRRLQTAGKPARMVLLIAVLAVRLAPQTITTRILEPTQRLVKTSRQLPADQSLLLQPAPHSSPPVAGNR